MSESNRDSRASALSFAIRAVEAKAASVSLSTDLIALAREFERYLTAPPPVDTATPPSVTVPSSPPPAEGASPKPRGRPRKADAPVADAPAPIAEPSTPPASASASPSDKPPTVEEVRAVLVAVQTQHDKATALGILNKYTGGAGVLSKLAEGDRAKVIAEGKALCA